MDGNRFDDLTRTLARSGSRRQALKALAGAAGMGLGLFGRSSRSSAAAQVIDATSIKAGPLQGQANQDAAFRALRHYLQQAGFQPEGAAEAVDVFEDGTWVASVLGRSYASRQSGATGTLAYVVTASGTVSLAVLASGVPYAVLSVGADGGIVETPIPESVAGSATDVPARNELVHARIDRSRAMASAMSYPAAKGVSIQPALAQGSAICDDCEGICEPIIEMLITGLCTSDLWQTGIFSRLRFIGAIAARCAATTAGTPVCVAIGLALCGALGYIGYRSEDICGAGCTRLGCAAAAPPPPPTQCGVCQVLENGACVERTDCAYGCDPDTGECYPEPECTADTDCLECQTCNVDTGFCEGECYPEPGQECGLCEVLENGACVERTDCAYGCDPDTGECYPEPGLECGPCQVLENDTCVEIAGCEPEPVCGPCSVLQVDCDPSTEECTPENNGVCVGRACPGALGCNPETGECYPADCPSVYDIGDSACVGRECLGKSCVSGCVMTAEGVGACVPTGELTGTWWPYCSDTQPTQPGADECTVSEDCPPGWVCSGSPVYQSLCGYEAEWLDTFCSPYRQCLPTCSA